MHDCDSRSTPRWNVDPSALPIVASYTASLPPAPSPPTRRERVHDLLIDVIGPPLWISCVLIQDSGLWPARWRPLVSK